MDIVKRGSDYWCYQANTKNRCEHMQCFFCLPPTVCSLLTTTWEHTTPKVYCMCMTDQEKKRCGHCFWKNLLCVHINTVFAVCMHNWPASSVRVCVCIQTMHSVDSPQQWAFLLGEYMSPGLVPPSMTSGEAIIFCINDEQQPAMREMDFVLGHSSADYGQQQCWQK